MPEWFIYSLIAFFFIGVQRFLYKTIAEKGIDPDVVTFFFMAGVAVMSSSLYFVRYVRVDNIFLLFILSLGNSLSFLIATLSHIKALKYIKASIAYPLIRLNIVVVVIFSIFFLKETISIAQFGGIIIALLCMLLLTKEQAKKGGDTLTSKQPYKGFGLIFLAMLCGAASSITSKLAAVKVPLIPFIALSYIIGSLYLFIANFKRIVKNTTKTLLIVGFGMSILNFAGFYFYLKGLSTGPLSIISSINGLHFVVAVVFSVLIYKESISKINFIAVLLAIFSIILLKGF